MRNIIYIFFLLFIIVFTGCRSSEELIYLQNAGQDELLKGLSQDQTEYLIKPGDILYVSIKSLNSDVNVLFNPEEGMQQSSTTMGYQKYTTPQGAYLYGFEVDEKGNLNLPILGKIAVAGNQQQDIEKLVQARADQFLKEATVKVKLLNYRVTVLGEVKSPGVYYNYNNDFTVLQAIAMANGNTDYARIKRVMVMRPEKGGKRTYILDMTDKNIFDSPAFYLHPNDYVFVEPDKYKSLSLNSQVISVSLSSLSILVAIIGVLW